MSMESDDTASVGHLRPHGHRRWQLLLRRPHVQRQSAFGRINAISRAGYLSSVRSKSVMTVVSANRYTEARRPLPLSSAEAIPEGPQTRSIVERMVICQMLKGDLRWMRPGRCP